MALDNKQTARLIGEELDITEQGIKNFGMFGSVLVAMILTLMLLMILLPDLFHSNRIVIFTLFVLLIWILMTALQFAHLIKWITLVKQWQRDTEYDYQKKIKDKKA